MKRITLTPFIRLTSAALLTSLLGACANSGIGISIPVGPFGSVGIGMNSAGQISGTVGVGTSVGGVGIGGGTSFPIGTVGSAAPANPAPSPAPATPAPAAQAGSSQNVPR